MNTANRRIGLWAIAAALMVVPVAIERALNGIEWDVGDAMFLCILLTGLAVAGELAARAPVRRAFAVGTGIAIAAALLQAWINLAVGVIGSEDNPANFIYAGVIAVALGGAIFARLRPADMARAMVVTAVAQVAAFAVALASGLGFTGPITVFFTSLWLIAGWSFRRAATRDLHSITNQTEKII